MRDRAKPEAFILIVILPNSAAPIRTAVKHWGDVKYGMSINQSNSYPGSKVSGVFRSNDSMPSAREIHGRQQSVLEQRSLEVSVELHSLPFSQTSYIG